MSRCATFFHQLGDGTLKLNSSRPPSSAGVSFGGKVRLDLKSSKNMQIARLLGSFLRLGSFARARPPPGKAPPHARRGARPPGRTEGTPPCRSTLGHRGRPRRPRLGGSVPRGGPSCTRTCTQRVGVPSVLTICGVCVRKSGPPPRHPCKLLPRPHPCVRALPCVR